MDQNLEKIFLFMWILQKLKDNKRWLDTPTVLKKESVADHSFKVIVMAFVVWKNIWIDLDKLKILKLALVHDLIEAIAWDTDYNSVYLWLISKQDKYNKELEAIKEIKEILPPILWQEIYDLWFDYDSSNSNEAKFLKAVEKTEAIDHVLYYGPSTINIPHKFATYCDNAMLNFPLLKWYYHWYKQELKKMFIEWGHKWEDSYETKWDFLEFKDFDKIYNFFQIAQKLKETRRYETMTKDAIKESVAEHSFRLIFFVWISKEILNLDINLQRALEIAIFHDIIEAFAWDTDFQLVWSWKVSKEEKRKKEVEAMEKIKGILPPLIWNQIYDLWNEYEEFETKEAKLVKALDKLESIDHFIRNWSEYYDNPDRIVYYLNSPLKFCPLIKPIHHLYKEKLKKEFLDCWIWEKEFDED